jgi:hypothetical protein
LYHDCGSIERIAHKEALPSAYISPCDGSEDEVGVADTICRHSLFLPSFGDSKPEELVWTSVLEGKIGTGQQFIATDLPVGFHW